MPALNISVHQTQHLDSAVEQQMCQLFSATYDDADLDYVQKSKSTFRHVATAMQDGAMVGFCFADSLEYELPGFDSPQCIALAGLGCIDPVVRQQGLFSQLMTAAMTAGDGLQAGRRCLFAGRMAHTITYRTMAKLSASVVPAPGVVLSSWHKDVASAVARILHSEIDPETFVSKGSGKPVGSESNL